MAAMILPPAMIGMLGGGQLGRMSLLAGRRMGYRFRLFEPKAPCAAAPVADEAVHAPYDDTAALERFARGCDVVTLEFENIPDEVISVIEKHAPVRPAQRVLSLCQHRAREKGFLSENGFPLPPFAVVQSADELAAAVERIGTPAVLKTAAFGYDGKGQQKLTGGEDPTDVWAKLGAPAGVLEGFVDFSGEYSVLVARTPSGAVQTFPLVENIHRHHILHLSLAPARGVAPKRAQEAEALARDIAEKIGLEGLLAVELFLTGEGTWLVNELAPRPHNSGHWTIEGCATSQFEQHIRAVCDLPLGDTAIVQPSCMLNLLGDLWARGEPDWATVLRNPRAKLHLYDKGEAKPGRKMGHVTILGDTAEEALEGCEALFAELSAKAGQAV